jgi:predicted ABC-type ATPase
MNSPKVYIFAGANGSGKTTLAKSLLQKGTAYINADEIKKSLGIPSLDAGRQALLAIDRHIEQKRAFAFETTMSGLTLRNRFKALKARKYDITIYYLFAYPIDLLEERIKERVKKGGHTVDYKDIVRRYYRSTTNFWEIYKKYADTWIIVLNNEHQYKNIASGNKQRFYTLDETEFAQFTEVIRHG